MSNGIARRIVIPAVAGAITFAWLGTVAVRMPARATTTISPDGVWWNQLTRDERLLVVEGEIDGFQGGFVSSKYGDTRRDKIDMAASAADYGTLLAERRAGRLSAAEFQRIVSGERAAEKAALARLGPAPEDPGFPRTFGSYADAITDFYADHPDAATVLISTIMRCLADPPLLSCDTVAKEYR